jgi:phosphopantothenoylcysteine decarboxylase/phosphopantothenate--cysteine ligase
MGYALAEACRRRGARVLLVSGPTHLEPPAGVSVERVRSAEEMAQAVFGHLAEATVVLMAAAVADFRPAEARSGKIKKQRGAPVARLEPTTDILAEIARRRRREQLVVGFAAEADHLLENAAAKVRAKRLDMIVANDVSQEGAGFDVDTNIVALLFPDGRKKALEKMSKLDVANRVLDEVVEIRKKESPRSEVRGPKPEKP